MSNAALIGFFTGFSLILAIGAQNTFVLRQGLLGSHIGLLCLICALSDAVLIALGVAGFGALVSAFPRFNTVISLAGAGFLIVYGALRVQAALLKNSIPITMDKEQKNLAVTLISGLALTWLNPHVYLDTLGLVGAVSTRYPDMAEKWAFGGGAILASFVFFFSLGYGAQLLRPIMTSPKSWRVLDFSVGIIMWIIAIKLLL